LTLWIKVWVKMVKDIKKNLRTQKMPWLWSFGGMQ
jgi:hypothetical protein